MKLIISHHAFIRLGDWHPEYRDLVPSGKVTLNADQVSRMMAALGVLVWSMEQGRPSTLLESANEAKREKYGRRSFYIFDRESGDLFQMIRKSEDTFALMTVTLLKNTARGKILDDLSGQFRFSDVTEIALPYLLNFEASLLEPSVIITPSGRIIPVSYGCQVFDQDEGKVG